MDRACHDRLGLFRIRKSCRDHGLARTGVAGLIGRPVLRLVGESDARHIALIMLVVRVLSGLVNDIGVAALMLPVVVDIANDARHAGGDHK